LHDCGGVYLIQLKYICEVRFGNDEGVPLQRE
jgi:hypothetical protein